VNKFFVIFFAVFAVINAILAGVNFAAGEYGYGAINVIVTILDAYLCIANIKERD
jgi:hypothetical protein